jgi:peptidyl-prolyl cis-trans isomerase A (cyclophilin A)
MKKSIAIIITSFLLAGCINTASDVSNDKVGLNDTIRLKTGDNNPTPVASDTLLKTTSQTMQATIQTTMGDIVIKLFPDKAPKTVANFVGLAEGTQPWVDPKSGEKQTTKSLYKGTIFHRVIKDFMIQGGDPLGMGTGGPGYRFEDEISDLKFDKPYLLAMANSGPGTNGSQFFITVVETPWLTGKHTIFGEVVTGKEIVDAIVNTPTKTGDKPVTDVVINDILIAREQ